MTVNFLLEIFQEEIPARMQAKAATQLSARFTRLFADAALRYDAMEAYVTPLRLVLHVEGLAEMQPDQVTEKKGPMLSAPQQAIDGFLRSNGLSDIAECDRVDTPKGEALLFRRTIAGQATRDLLPRLITQILQDFAWPNSMRFADQDFRWIRPLRQIMASVDGVSLQGDIQLASRTIPFAQNVVLQRYPQRLAALPKDFAEYQGLLAAENIILNAADRRQALQKGLAAIAQDHGCVWREDIALLDEVTGLLEQVHLIAGTIEPRFMALPDTLLRLTLRSHQKYFVFNEKNGETLSPLFAIATSKSGEFAQTTVLQGNLRVLRARLQDAEFFLAQDQRLTLLQHAEKLKDLRFVEGLGTMHHKAIRIATLLQKSPTNLSQSAAVNMALMAKADLITEMVGEFPELQGFIAAHYAQNEGVAADIVQALATQYSPKGSGDSIPPTPLSCGLAMMDKIDTIAGFTSKNSLPTGSGDPFAIRRAMLGVIRIAEAQGWLGILPELFRVGLANFSAENIENQAAIHEFFRARMVQYLREQGIDTHVALAAFDSEIADTPALARGLQDFLQTPDGAALRTTYQRAAGILKQNTHPPTSTVIVRDQMEAADLLLWDSVQEVQRTLSNCEKNIGAYFSALSKLSLPLDNFFNMVLINTEDTAIKNARLSILQAVVHSVKRVAQFDRLISG